jgi:hypothetical protein
MSLIFISYRREDSAGYAGRLHEALERRLGEGQVFRDAETLEPGQDFVEAINVRLRHCRACLVLIGREWLDARDTAGRRRLDHEHDYVRLEIAAALARPDVVVIPVLVEDEKMPAETDLPDSIRPLSRRHAVSLRDESWDFDVDRLEKSLRKSIGSGDALSDAGRAAAPVSTGVRQPAARTLRWAAIGAVLLAALFAVRELWRDDEGSGETTPTTTTAQVPAAGSDQPAGAPAYAIAIPPVAEAAHGNLIYTVLSGDVSRAGDTNRVRLRVRLSNERNYPANFWDNSFRLAVPGQVLAPTSGLNEVLDSHASRQGVVSFDVPAGAEDAVLRVVSGADAAELPLALKPTGEPSRVDRMDTSDALSRALVATFATDPTPLVSEKDASYALVSATARRFANTLRVSVTVRVTNLRRYPLHFSSNALRLLANGENIAPFEGPNEAVAAGAMATADFVFDVPPPVERVALHTTGESVTEIALDVPSTVR